MKRIVVIIILILFVGASGRSPLRAQGEKNEILNFDYSYSKEKIRLVFELKRIPDYNVYLNGGGSEIIIDFADCSIADDFSLPQLKYDFLLADIDKKTVNFRRTQFVVKLKYKITYENLEEIILKDPHRLCVDIFREYSITQVTSVTKNITHIQRLVMGLQDKILVNELIIDKNDKDINFKVAVANGNGASRGKLSDMALKEGALAAVNGGFFARDGGPVGLIIIDGKIMCHTVKKRPPRTAFGITADKKIVFDTVFSKNGDLMTKDGTDWKGVVYAIGAGPRLVKDGQIFITADEEELGPKGNDITKKAARAAIGVTHDDKLVIATVSGYTSNEGQGVGLYSLASRLIDLNVAQAMNLDGGGSTMMWIDNNIVSNPPEAKSNFERKIADSFLVFDSSKNLLPSSIRIEVSPREIIADGVSKVGVNAFVYDKEGSPVPDGTLVFFGSVCGRISVYAKTVNGMAHAYLSVGRRLGWFKITARSGFVVNEASVFFKPDSPSLIFTNFKKDEDNYNLQVLVTDKYYNPAQDKKVLFKINDKEYPIQTDSSGVAQININKEDDSPINVTVEADGVKPEILELP